MFPDSMPAVPNGRPPYSPGYNPFGASANGPEDTSPSTWTGSNPPCGGTTEIQATRGSGFGGGFNGGRTVSDCFGLPLKNGGTLKLSWNRLNGQGQIESSYANDQWRPAGGSAVFSFLPRLNLYQIPTGGVRRYDEFGTIAYDSSNVPQEEMAFSATRNTTYFTEFDQRDGVYYEYWGGTNLTTYFIFGRLNRRYDTAGNQLTYNYTNNSFAEPHLRSITGDFAGNIVPYFEYWDDEDIVKAAVSKIYILDKDNVANSRSVYFDYVIDTTEGTRYITLNRVTNPAGCVRLYDRTPFGFNFYVFLREMDAEGYQTYFEYNFDPLSRCIEPEGRITYYDYSSASESRFTLLGRQPTITGYAISGSTGSMPMVTRQVDALGNVTYYNYYPSLNRPRNRMDANRNVTYFHYLGTGQNPYALVAQVSTFDGATVYYGYDNGNYDATRVVGPRHTNAFPVVRYFTYDAGRRRTSSIDPLGSVVRMGRDFLGRLVRHQDERGNTTYFNYSASTGFLDSQGDAAGFAAYFGYDNFGNQTRVISSRWSGSGGGFAQFATYYEYDQLNRRIKSIDPLRNVTYFDWSSRSTLLDTVDAVGTTTAYTYNGLRLRTQKTVTDSAGSQLTQSKNGFDIYLNRVQMLDGRGNATYFGYDQLDRLTARQDALLNVTYYVYDSVGNRTAVTDARNNTTLSAFDQLSRKTAQQDALGKSAYYFYDLADNRTHVVDRRNNATYYFYDQNNRMQSMRDALGNPTYYFYDATGNRTVLRDARTNSTYYFYDERNLNKATRDALGNLTYFVFDASRNIIRGTDPRSNATTYQFDVLDRMSTVRDAVGNAVYFQYDQVGNRTLIYRVGGGYGIQPYGTSPYGIGDRNALTYFFYDGLHRLKAMRDALGNYTYYFYDPSSNRTHAVDARLNPSYFFYDALNRPSVIRTALGNATYYFYDAVGNRTHLVDARLNAGYFFYDALDRLSAVRDAQGNPTYFFFDAEGNVLAQKNSLFHATYFIYDALNRRTASQDALGGTTYFEFDPAGDLTRTIDPNNHATQTRFDASNRPDAARMADSGSVYFFYDAASNRTNVIDPRGNATYYAYDVLNRASAVQDALGRALYFQYDFQSNMSRFVNAEGSASAHVYDGLSRRTACTYVSAGSNIAASLGASPYYVYDAVSNMTQMGDQWGLHRMAYDGENRLVTRQYPNGSAIYFEYDGISNRTTVTFPGSAGRSGAAYDSLDRQTRVQSPSGATAYFAYNAVSNPTQRFLGNSVRVDAAYDRAERLSTYRWSKSTAAPLSYFDYSRDAKGLITKALREATHTIYYAYDACDRLLSEVWASGVTEVYGYRYAYDLAGNRTQARVNGSDTYYQYDRANQLTMKGTTALFASATYYAYDRNGSLVVLAEPSGTTRFAYNAAGLVARIAWMDASATYFFYDGSLQRYAMVAAGQTTATYFLWEGPNLLQELNADGTVKEEHTNSRTPVAGVGQLVETNRPGQAQPKLYPVMDPRGTITKWIQSDGTTVFASREYDAFGNLVPNSAAGTWPGRFGYQGQGWIDVLSGNGSQRLSLTPTRIYDPSIGRFVQNEPIAGRRWNWQYLYAGNSPVVLTDPQGLLECPVTDVEDPEEEVEDAEADFESPEQEQERNGSAASTFLNNELDEITQNMQQERLQPAEGLPTSLSGETTVPQATPNTPETMPPLETFDLPAIPQTSSLGNTSGTKSYLEHVDIDLTFPRSEILTEIERIARGGLEGFGAGGSRREDITNFTGRSQDLVSPNKLILSGGTTAVANYVMEVTGIKAELSSDYQYFIHEVLGLKAIPGNRTAVPWVGITPIGGGQKGNVLYVGLDVGF